MTEQERRAEDRRRALKSTTIVFNNRMSTMSAQVRNESAAGAMLIVDNTAVIPSQIELLNYPTRGYHDAEIAWRSENAIGIRLAAAGIHALAPNPALNAQAEREDGGEERRTIARRRALKTTNIVFNNRMSTMQAKIRNESPEGAMLIVDNTSIIPSQIELLNYPTQGYHDVEIVWRSETAVGIRFVTATKAMTGWDGTERRQGRGRRADDPQAQDDKGAA